MRSVCTGLLGRRLATLALLATLTTTGSAATVAAAAPSPAPSSLVTFDPSGTERVLDAVRAVDPRFAELPDVEDAQRRADHALIMAGSWVDVLDTFGRLAVQVPGTTVDDPWYGLGGSVVQVMLVADCVTEDVLSYVVDPSKGDPCGWRHTWLYRVSGSGEATLLYDEGSPDTP
jgi:hypothetical protein